MTTIETCRPPVHKCLSKLFVFRSSLTIVKFVELATEVVSKSLVLISLLQKCELLILMVDTGTFEKKKLFMFQG